MAQTLPSHVDNLHTLNSPEQLQTLLGADLTKLSVLYFRAEWADICKRCDLVVRELAKQWTNTIFLEIEAEALPEVSESFDIESVPYFIFLRGHTLLHKIAGAQLDLLKSTVEKHASSSTHKRYEAMSQTNMKPEAPPTTVPNSNSNQEMVDEDESEEEILERCKTIMKQSNVVLFMKGNPDAPRCGFSQQTVKILKEENIDFTSFDVLQDDSIRQGMKQLNSWPTFPQLIVKGELVGGLDILKEMVQTGELQDLLKV